MLLKTLEDEIKQTYRIYAQCFKLLWDLTDMKQLWSLLAVSGHFYTNP